MSSLGPGRPTASDAVAGDPVELGSPAASVAAKLGWKPVAVTHPSPAPATVPSTSTGSASFLALELRPNRQSRVDFMTAPIPNADQCVIEAQPSLHVEMF